MNDEDVIVVEEVIVDEWDNWFPDNPN
jgi:hypothetical protein